jgi:hypothetical protein
MNFRVRLLEAANVGDAVLVQDRRHVGLGDIVGEAGIFSLPTRSFRFDIVNSVIVILF